MRKLSFLVLVGMFAISGISIADSPIPHSNYKEVFTGTSGAADPKTLSGVSYDWYICNQDSTASNTLSIKWDLNTTDADAATALVVRGGECISTTNYATKHITITAVNNTPVYRLVCLEVK